MFCQNCGAENKDHAIFCENCGQRLEKDEMFEHVDDRQQKIIKKTTNSVRIAGFVGIFYAVMGIPFIMYYHNSYTIERLIDLACGEGKTFVVLALCQLIGYVAVMIASVLALIGVIQAFKRDIAWLTKRITVWLLLALIATVILNYGVLELSSSLLSAYLDPEFYYNETLDPNGLIADDEILIASMQHHYSEFTYNLIMLSVSGVIGSLTVFFSKEYRRGDAKAAFSYYDSSRISTATIKKGVAKAGSHARSIHIPRKVFITAFAILMCIAIAAGGLAVHKNMTQKTYYLVGNLSLDESAYGYSSSEGNYFEDLDNYIINDMEDDWLLDHIQNDQQRPKEISKSDWRKLMDEIVYSSDDIFAEDGTSVDQSICKNGEKVTIECSIGGAYETSPISKLEKKYNCKILFSPDSDNETYCTKTITLDGWPKAYETATDVLKEKRDVLERIEFKGKQTLKSNYSYMENLKVSPLKLYYATAEKDPSENDAYVVCTYKVQYDDLGDTETVYEAVYAGPFTDAFNKSNLEDEDEIYSDFHKATYSGETENELLTTLKEGEFSNTVEYDLETIDM